MCPLRRDMPLAKARAEFWDVSDPEERDYHYMISMSLRHEYAGADGADCNR